MSLDQLVNPAARDRPDPRARKAAAATASNAHNRVRLLDIRSTAIFLSSGFWYTSFSTSDDEVQYGDRKTIVTSPSFGFLTCLPSSCTCYALFADPFLVGCSNKRSSSAFDAFAFLSRQHSTLKKQFVIPIIHRPENPASMRHRCW